MINGAQEVGFLFATKINFTIRHKGPFVNYGHICIRDIWYITYIPYTCM